MLFASMVYAFGALGGRSHLLRFQWLIRADRIIRCLSSIKVPFASFGPCADARALAGMPDRRQGEQSFVGPALELITLLH